MSTRPRISFDQNGVCNACRWAEEKKQLDWEKREIELRRLLESHKHKGGTFDCLVPVSGGKDGSYVAFNLKEKYGMNPLCVTVTPALPLALGERNLKAFVESGYNHISVNPNNEVMKFLNKKGLIDMGFPYYGWLIAIHTIPLRIAISLNIGLIFYGEDGEIEYGGSTETLENPIYGIEYQKRVYLEGGYNRLLETNIMMNPNSYFFHFPSEEEAQENDLKITHWSYFENWDPYRNYLVAKEKCGLMESDSSNAGTFTNFAQNDQSLYALHTYLMYLKYGFGRANQDASIEVRRGAMSREQALSLVKLFDGAYPEAFVDEYLDYFELSRKEFDLILDKYANKNLFEKVNGRWSPNFTIR
jgi:N-acetyl sugar amidotransferase